MNKRKAEMIRSIQPQIDAEFPRLMNEISGYAAEHQGGLREGIRQCALKARPLIESGKRAVCCIVISLLASSFKTGSMNNRKAVGYATDLPGGRPSAYFYIYRTEDLKPEDLESLDPCTIFSGALWFSAGRDVPLYKSKNGKYMMWIDGGTRFFLPERYRMIENFCAIED